MRICAMDMEYHIANGYLEKGMINMNNRIAALIMNVASCLLLFIVGVFFLDETNNYTHYVVMTFFCLLQSIYFKL